MLTKKQRHKLKMARSNEPESVNKRRKKGWQKKKQNASKKKKQESRRMTAGRKKKPVVIEKLRKRNDVKPRRRVWLKSATVRVVCRKIEEGANPELWIVLVEEVAVKEDMYRRLDVGKLAEVDLKIAAAATTTVVAVASEEIVLEGILEEVDMKVDLVETVDVAEEEVTEIGKTTEVLEKVAVTTEAVEAEVTVVGGVSQ
jgi:hypothetical protein